jgi:hypothetical protein
VRTLAVRHNGDLIGFVDVDEYTIERGYLELRMGYGKDRMGNQLSEHLTNIFLNRYVVGPCQIGRVTLIVDPRADQIKYLKAYPKFRPVKARKPQ